MEKAPDIKHELLVKARTNLNIELLQRLNNYPGLERLVKLAKEKHPEISRREIKTYLDQDTSRQLTKVQHKKPAPGHVVAMVPNELWQMDIFDLSKYMKQNKNYRYILCCIDVFTRKAFCEPMLYKDSEAVTKAFARLLAFNKVQPRSIISDNDAAFQTLIFQKLLELKEIAINYNALHDHHVLGIIDNFARRLKTILTTTFLKEGNTQWLDRLQRILDIYNQSQHSGINDIAPDDASKPKNKEEILKLNMDKQLHNKTVSDLELGDKVRKTMLKGGHEIIKGTDPRWTDEVFMVKQIHGNTVILNDDSKMKRTDLLKVPSTTKSSVPNVIAQARKAYSEFRKIKI
jgi:transposase InsO family protein